MTVWIRIALYIFAGWLSSSGYINEEVKSMLTNDPEVAAGIQAVAAGLIAGGSAAWWRLAKRFGWST